MKRLTMILLVLCAALASVFSLDLSEFDSKFETKTEWQESLDRLEILLAEADTPEEKAEVYWRMSLFACYIGSDQEKNADKRKFYAKGIQYAELGMEADPLNKYCILWHCACMGRDAQTRGLSSQLNAVETMRNDLDRIINVLGIDDFSEAWHALGEIYWRHPFMSTASAVSFFRRTIDTIPEGEIRLVSYQSLAEALYSRNWSAKKRVSELASQQKKWNAGKFSTTMDRYAVYEGRGGSSVTAPWTDITPLGSMSDREEAKSILLYAKNLYEKSAVKGDADTKNYNEIQDLLSKW